MSQPPNLSPTEPQEYSSHERELLLRLAHAAVEATLRGERLDKHSPSPHLAEHRGAFTTWHLNGALRGCIGYVLPVASLYETVLTTAAAAAFQDPRFLPVTVEEAPFLKAEISVMSPLVAIGVENIVVGKHGLLVTYQGRRGLLLPQVASGHGWDRESFLSETCLKAGVRADAWRAGATIEAFTAEIFGE